MFCNIKYETSNSYITQATADEILLQKLPTFFKFVSSKSDFFFSLQF